MEFKNYTTDSFIMDESFQQWVYSPDVHSDSYWHEVLQAHPELRDHMEEARQFLLLFNLKENEVSETRRARLKQKINEAIDAADLPPHEEPLAVNMKGTRAEFPYLRFAAVISFVIAAAFVFLYANPSALKLFSDRKKHQTTAKGERSTITLADGTSVWLNADSKLTYPKVFSGKTREVFLDGEAFFDVSEDPAKPFIVRTSAISVRVLGTSFNVRSYDQDDQIRTTLVKGKIILSVTDDESNQLTLKPSQQAVFEKHSRKITLENKVITENFTAWREGKLSFEGQPLSLIIKELERWYDVTIIMENESSLNCPFSAKINNKTLVEVLDLFNASDGIEYTIDEKKVYIKGSLCNE